MSIRSNARGTGYDLAPELQNILRKNGMQAHVIQQGDAYQLVVQGHDSPLLTYKITAKQLHDLTDWGTNYANKTAYNTFTSLIADDFHLPKNFVHARNANGRVVMGLHGYRIGSGEYGRPMNMPMHPVGMHHHRLGHHHFWGGMDRGFLGWTPREQPGFHGRRVGGAYFMQGAPFVPVRPDGRMKPGELTSGGYGFYYKGQQAQTPVPQQDVLRDLQVAIPPVVARPRPADPARPYKELITSDVYFTNDKWQEVLASHGIVIDAENKTLTIQSKAVEQDFIYDLKDDEYAKLTSNSLKSATVQQRLDIINNVIQSDFHDKVTKDMLNSTEQINLQLTPETKAELQQKAEIREQQPNQQEEANNEEQLPPGVAQINGQDLDLLNENKAWYREGAHGREVQVDAIRVEPKLDANGEAEKDQKGNALYRMTAVINGETISHDITAKQYNKFMAVDDYHRMKLFSDIFKEVDMKTIPGKGLNFGSLMTGLAMTADMMHGVGHVVHEVEGIGRHHHTPEIYEEHHHSPKPHVYFKPGVDSPQDLATRAFEAGVNAANHGVGLGR